MNPSITHKHAGSEELVLVFIPIPRQSRGAARHCSWLGRPEPAPPFSQALPTCLPVPFAPPKWMGSSPLTGQCRNLSMAHSLWKQLSLIKSVSSRLFLRLPMGTKIHLLCLVHKNKTPRPQNLIFTPLFPPICTPHHRGEQAGPSHLSRGAREPSSDPSVLRDPGTERSLCKRGAMWENTWEHRDGRAAGPPGYKGGCMVKTFLP